MTINAPQWCIKAMDAYSMHCGKHWGPGTFSGCDRSRSPFSCANCIPFFQLCVQNQQMFWLDFFGKLAIVYMATVLSQLSRVFRLSQPMQYPDVHQRIATQQVHKCITSGQLLYGKYSKKKFGLSRSLVANPLVKNLNVDDHRKMSCVIAMHGAMWNQIKKCDK